MTFIKKHIAVIFFLMLSISILIFGFKFFSFASSYENQSFQIVELIINSTI